ncbi:ketoacyl-ACP synthase III family protein [Kibdelosporangium aridum]|uniref:ketoacyl-ACP synthase III family protein n=1 Tax=Kibdelosporangium aridum TaxID=2030 RepID=UPI000527847D
MNLYVAGVGTCLPDRQTAEEAIAANRYDAESARVDGVRSACVETERYPAELAAIAGQGALAMASGRDIGTFRAVFHSYVDYQGAHYWQAAPYVALHTVGRQVPSFDVVQECNGAMGALELGRRFVTGPDDAVLVTTGDRFDSPWVSRWYGDQSVLADGGSALVLSGASGFARILSLSTMADNSLEGEARGGEFAGAQQPPVDFDAMRKRFHAKDLPMLEHYGRMAALFSSSLRRVLDEAGITAADLAFAIPVVTTAARAADIADRFLQVPIERTNWEFGRTTGHLGTGDQFAGLHHLITTGKARRGDRILLLGGGTGYTITSAVLEMLEDSEDIA